jgi:uncharacterized glyoxalase superfamily protein PhnB
MKQPPTLHGVYLFVETLATSADFYRLLGFEVEHVSSTLARAVARNGALIVLGTAALTQSYDPAWRAPGSPTKNTINLELDCADEVDEIYRRIVDAGYVGHLAPCDPLWQARFAIVEDPDGNYIGLNGPRDLEADRRREHFAS